MLKIEKYYNLSLEEAEKVISNVGLDIPWNDGDVYIDERHITQTVANVIKWVIDRQKDKVEKYLIDHKLDDICPYYTDTQRNEISDDFIDDFLKYMEN